MYLTQGYFNPPPARGRLKISNNRHGSPISIHAPCAGRRCICCFKIAIYFNPPPLRGATLSNRRLSVCRQFQSPLRGATAALSQRSYFWPSFQSTPPARGDGSWTTRTHEQLQISIHAPCAGRLRNPNACARTVWHISIHAPLRGRLKPVLVHRQFGISIPPPCAGAWIDNTAFKRFFTAFQSTPLRGGDAINFYFIAMFQTFSIHAPRARGRLTKLVKAPRNGFQSTPPCGGRPQNCTNIRVL